MTEKFGADWPSVVSSYQQIVIESVEAHDGCLERGDATSIFASFSDANNALKAAADLQEKMRASQWSANNDIEVKATVGLHAGKIGEQIYIEPNESPKLVGYDVHRGARIRAAARSGQVLLSDKVRQSLGDRAAKLEDMGFHRLRDFPESVRLFNFVVFDDRKSEFFGAPDTLDYRPTNLTADERLLLGRKQVIHRVVESFAEGRRVVTLLVRVVWVRLGLC